MTTDDLQIEPSMSSPAPEEAAPLTPMARIKLIYESRDGRFCLFEDADGHLAAVDATKLA